MIGSRLGPYEITAKLGEGGMGEVYRARDTRLGRDVAIKVLPAAFSHDRDRLRRFEQEARAASALNHPGILTIHDVGTDAGRPYVVSELLEGQNLRERMADAPLPARKAIEFAVQMARSLAAAHDRGIVHRDLKPENLFVTRDGRLKILDFGLAKLIHQELSIESSDDVPTQTEGGMILGTLGYMSPEQVLARPADFRSDIFAFGAIVYEMLTGERAFRGDSAVETMNAILKEEPRALAEPSDRLDPALARVVRHCLEKDPADRYQGIRDAAFHLESVGGAERPATQPAIAATPRSALRWWIVLPLVALAALALGLLLSARRRESSPPDPIGVHRLTDFAGLEESPALSPDGNSIAFTRVVGEQRQIWVRLVRGGSALQLTHDDADHQAPRWAPDGASLVYYTSPESGESQGTLWELPALGGSPRRIGSAIGGADVSHDGQRIAYFRIAEDRMELVVAERDGRSPRPIAKLPLESYYLSPRWSPDDRQIAYQNGWAFTHDIFVVSSDGGTPRNLTREGRILSGFSWTVDGKGIVYSSARGSTVLYLPTLNLWRVGLDGAGLRQLTFGESSYVDPDLAAGGALVAARVRRELDLWKFPIGDDPLDNVRRGIRLTHQTGQVQTPSVGANDREVVYLSDSGGHGNLWVLDTETGAARQITYEQDPNVRLGVPVWSPDGTRIAIYATHDGVGGIWLVDPDGSNLRNLVPAGAWASWSRDGRWLYFNESTAGTSAFGTLKKIRPEGGRSVDIRSDKGNRPAISPDGSTLYFVIERPTVSGGADYEIRAANPEGGPSRLLINLASQRIPQWQLVHPVISPDGQWLAFPLTDGVTTNLWALPTAGGPLRKLTDFAARPTYIARRVSWSVDGKAIYVALGEGDADVVLLHGLRP